MDELSEQMRAAVVAPPPSRIDVDGLVAGERRRRRVRRMAGTGVAVVAVALAPLLLVVPGPATPSDPASSASAQSLPPPLCVDQGDPYPPSPESYDTVRPRPTEHPDDAIVRLTGVLRPTLSTQVPADIAVRGVRLPRAPSDCDLVQFRYDGINQLYRAYVVLTRGEQTNYLTVTVQPTRTDLPTPCADVSAHTDCTSTRLTDGSILISMLSRVGEFGHEQRTAQLRRADGTTVSANGTNLDLGPSAPAGRPTEQADPPMLSVEQLAALVQEPSLTFYP